MTLISAIVVALLFGGGVFLILQADALRVVAGTILLTNAAILFMVAGSVAHAVAPILPEADSPRVADPVVQALALTAIVIGFATTAVLLGLTYRLYVARKTLNLESLADAEQQEIEKADASATEEEAPWC